MLKVPEPGDCRVKGPLLARLTLVQVERDFGGELQSDKPGKPGVSPSCRHFGDRSTFRGCGPSPTPAAYSCAHLYRVWAVLSGTGWGLSSPLKPVRH